VNVAAREYEGFEWIVTDPDQLGGEPAIRGTRFTVAFIRQTGPNDSRELPTSSPQSPAWTPDRGGVSVQHRDVSP
jgi:hypothetical protein